MSLCHRWYSESSRWLVLNGRSEEALKHLHRVAKINGKPEMTEKITLEVSHQPIATFHIITYSYHISPLHV